MRLVHICCCSLCTTGSVGCWSGKGTSSRCSLLTIFVGPASGRRMRLLKVLTSRGSASHGDTGSLRLVRMVDAARKLYRALSAFLLTPVAWQGSPQAPQVSSHSPIVTVHCKSTMPQLAALWHVHSLFT
jgi:hypothetical protein